MGRLERQEPARRSVARAQADAVCVAALRGPESDRMAKMAAVLSAKPGSFK